jgi:hypothetical protein
MYYIYNYDILRPTLTLRVFWVLFEGYWTFEGFSPEEKNSNDVKLSPSSEYENVK